MSFIPLNTKLGPEGGYLPTSLRQRSVGIMMYRRYCSFRKLEENGLTPEDLVSIALYRRGPMGFTGISCTANKIFQYLYEYFGLHYRCFL